MKKKFKNYDAVMEYAKSIVEGRKVACRELIQAAERFLKDLENPAYDFYPKEAEFVIQIIEKTFVHKQGEMLIVSLSLVLVLMKLKQRKSLDYLLLKLLILKQIPI